MRILNQIGIEKFRMFLSEIRQGKSVLKPNLNDNVHSVPYPFECTLEEDRSFATKMELGKYILNLFRESGIKREEVTANIGLWSWMGYAMFETLTDKGDGRIKVGEDYRYIYSEDFRNRYRHLVWLPYDMISLHGESSARLFLYRQLDVQGDFIEQIVSRNELYSNKSVVSVATMLYYDETTASGKRGAQGRSRPGNLRRFVSVLKQLDLTFDLYTASDQDILSLLPLEFGHWKN